MSFELVSAAITALKKPGSSKGVSRNAIKAHIGDKATAVRVNLALKRAVKQGKIVQNKESFKLAKVAAPKKVKKAKKAVAKKPKKAAAKKVAKAAAPAAAAAAPAATGAAPAAAAAKPKKAKAAKPKKAAKAKKAVAAQ